MSPYFPKEVLPGSKVYLIHFDKSLHRDRHYVVFSEVLQGRIQKHQNGQSTAFMKGIVNQQISWHVPRITDGGKNAIL